MILVRPFTEADDVAGFHAARGILTSEGGKASHAALVARGMGRPAVVGADALAIDVEQRTISVDGTVVRAGERIAIDGTRGCVTLDDVPLVEAAGRASTSSACSAGPTSCAGWACARTPTTPRARGTRASSAPRGSGSAAQSTCSRPPTASRRCAR